MNEQEKVLKLPGSYETEVYANEIGGICIRQPENSTDFSLDGRGMHVALSLEQARIVAAELLRLADVLAALPK